MNRTRWAAAALLVPAIVLVGCGQAVETAVETATGNDVDISDEGVTISGEGGSVSIDSEGDTMTFTDEEQGLTVTTGADQELPEGWPADIPAPPAEAILSSGTDDSGVIIVSWSWGAMTTQDFDDYVAVLESAGYAKQADGIEQDYGDDGFLRGASLASATHEVTVNGQVMQGMGGITVSVSPVG